MVKHFDHLTIVVRDTERAKAFFAVLGFKEAMSVIIAGEPFASYMGVPGIEAEHVHAGAGARLAPHRDPAAALPSSRALARSARPRPEQGSA
jgi:catechol 2,3-dioxygenase-like lactoylglutathione lyase family enzyme